MRKEFYAVLDNVRSLYNVGSVFRTAEAMGFKKIYLSGITPAPLEGRQKREISKTALGAENYVFWQKISQTWKLLEILKKEGVYLIGLELTKKAMPIQRLKLPKNHRKIALVIGNEVAGLSPKIIRRCQKIVKIPMLGKKESLNVSVAFGIAAFWLRQNLL